MSRGIAAFLTQLLRSRDRHAAAPTPLPDPGREAAERGDYATALSLWRPLAEAGDARAQYNVGGLYSLGQGVSKDSGAAVAWRRRAADQGYPAAEAALGVAYLYGDGAPHDWAAAAKWLKRAAERGDLGATLWMAWLCAQDRGTPRDEAEEVRWLRLAAKLGDAQSQARLGWMLWGGRGVGQDHAEALGWFRKAADRGNVYGASWLAWAYWKGDGVRQSNARAARWYRRAALHGDAAAQYHLGWRLARGRGTLIDRAEGWALLTLAARSFSAAEPALRRGAVLERGRAMTQMSRLELSEARRLQLAWPPGSGPRESVSRVWRRGLGAIGTVVFFLRALIASVAMGHASPADQGNNASALRSLQRAFRALGQTLPSPYTEGPFNPLYAILCQRDGRVADALPACEVAIDQLRARGPIKRNTDEDREADRNYLLYVCKCVACSLPADAAGSRALAVKVTVTYDKLAPEKTHEVIRGTFPLDATRARAFDAWFAAGERSDSAPDSPISDNVGLRVASSAPRSPTRRPWANRPRRPADKA